MSHAQNKNRTHIRWKLTAVVSKPHPDYRAHGLQPPALLRMCRSVHVSLLVDCLPPTIQDITSLTSGDVTTIRGISCEKE